MRGKGSPPNLRHSEPGKRDVNLAGYIIENRGFVFRRKTSCIAAVVKRGKKLGGFWVKILIPLGPGQRVKGGVWLS